MFSQAPCHENLWGSGGIALRILNFSTRCRSVVSFMPWLLHPTKRTDTHWIGGWVGSRAGLDVVVKKKIPVPSRN